MKIKLSLPNHWGSNLTVEPFVGRNRTWNGHEIFVDSNRKSADAWVIFDEVNPSDNQCLVPPDRTFFVTAESAWAEDHWLSQERTAFLGQFAEVRSSHVSNHPRFQAAPPFLPWMVHGNHGTTWASTSLDFETLRSLPIPPKLHPLSVICSSKVSYPGHKIRFNFVKRLKEHFGERLHWFGNGVHPLRTKWEGLAPYSATIAIENQVRPDLYTEKLFDPLLTYTVPIYAGATNIHKYFDLPDEWLIDLRDFSQSVERIELLLGSINDQSNKAALEINRSRVLGEAHFIERIVSMVSGAAGGLAPEARTLKPVASKRPRKSLGSRVWPATKERFRRTLSRNRLS